MLRTASLSRLRLASGLALFFFALGCHPDAVATTVPAPRAPCATVEDPEAASRLEHEIRIFDTAGREHTLGSMLDQLAEREVVLFGETHLDDVTHRLEHAVLEGLAQRRHDHLVLSMEMFERDVQPVLDRYLAGEIDETALLTQSRPWGNYRPDYRPLVETARTRGLPVVAANTPRPILRRAAEGAQGFAEARAQHPQWLPEQIFPASDAYWDRVDRAIRGHGPPPGGDRTYAVQNLWDNTMADAIVGAASAHPDDLILHIVGAFHIEHHDGTFAQVHRRAPALDIATITVVPTDDLARVEPAPERADFIVYAHRYADGPSGDELAVAMPGSLRYRVHTPDGPAPADGWPMLIWLADDEQRAADSLLRWRLAMGTEAVVVIVEPPHHTLARGGWLVERWAWPQSLSEDLSASSIALARILEYTRRGLGVKAAPVVLAGEGAGATLALWTALYGNEWSGVRVLAFAPELPRALRSAAIPEERSAVQRLDVRGELDDGTLAGLRGAAIEPQLSAAAAAGGPRDMAVREALGLSATPRVQQEPLRPDPAVPVGGAGKPIDVVVAKPTALSESWGGLYASLLRARGHDATLVLRESPTTPGATVLRFDVGGAEQTALLLGIFGEGGQGLPSPPDVFGGAVVLLVPRASGKIATQRWSEALAKHEATLGFMKAPYRAVLDGDARALASVFDELRANGRTEVLVVPAELCATAERMQAHLAWVEAEGTGLSLHWLPGLGHHTVRALMRTD